MCRMYIVYICYLFVFIRHRPLQKMAQKGGILLYIVSIEYNNSGNNIGHHMCVQLNVQKRSR